VSEQDLVTASALLALSRVERLLRPFRDRPGSGMHKAAVEAWKAAAGAVAEVRKLTELEGPDGERD